MAGILNKKERIMDVIVTREGRRQMADGDLRATFASFTDAHAFYEKDSETGSTDPSTRLYFEAFSRSSDQIIFENDDSGRLIGDLPISDLTLIGDNIFKKDAEGEFLAITDNAAFNSEAAGIVTSSITNFKAQRILGSVEGDENNSMSFDLSRNKISFVIDNKKPFGSNPNNFSIDVQAALPLFFDPKLVGSPNFQYLPPVHDDGMAVANFERLQTPSTLRVTNVITKVSGDILSSDEKKKLLFVKDDVIRENSNEVENTVYNPYEIESAFVNAALDAAQIPSDFIQNETVNILNTSPLNNMLCQVFEVDHRGNDKKLQKLDVFNAVNFSFSDEASVAYGEELSQIKNKHKSIYYVGKTFKDDLGVPTFIKIFTLMFD